MIKPETKYVAIKIMLELKAVARVFMLTQESAEKGIADER